MFVQHMLTVLRPGGLVCTVMPHGVLFRGGAEKSIRKGFIEDDLIDAVVGLGPNLFYGTGIPACILVLRAKGSRPADRQDRVLFINADREYFEGRAQNYLLPEHIEKIVNAYERYEEIPGFAALVTPEALAENDYNLNIRRYADNAPRPSRTMCGRTSWAESRGRRSRRTRTCSRRTDSTRCTSSWSVTTATSTSCRTSRRGPRSSSASTGTWVSRRARRS